ncbi:Extracellular metalloprotease precursor [Vibrio aerogenes CECT 7868]|uniref:Serine protease n=1 Tax=Vibrio aerogenes CECT 7868 TaxID=1216006 RepID=A0A1M5WV91_9VIBR|nr:trypsin-like serine protease [Vibrio aerogenes]SHH91479.1 Extracellular metalloprotease precursor [Vibrio aerogenes CECT 7868]
MKKNMICLSFAGLFSLGVSANELSQFVEMDQKANFIEGVNIVQPPIADETATFAESVAQRAQAMSAVAVNRDGSQSALSLSVEALTALEQAAQGLHRYGLDEKLFYSPEKAATIAPFSSKTRDAQGVVIGAEDSRTRVTNTTSAPYQYIGRIDIGCTGTLIGDKYVLTAGHCVSNGAGSWYRELGFSAGQNGSAKPWGTSSWKTAVTTSAWLNNGNSNYDYALIVLDEAPNGGHASWGIYSGGTHAVTGYPGDKPFGTMWTDSGTTSAISDYRICYTLDTAGGESGSAIRDNSNVVRGIHTTGSSSRNCGTRLTSTVYATLQDWMSAYQAQ